MKHLTCYEKYAIALTGVCLVLFGALFFIHNFGRLFCPLCKAELDPDEIYLWDVHAGVFLPLSPYLSGQSDALWFDSCNFLPQEVSVTRQCGLARFPGQIETQARYCRDHTPGNSRFAAFTYTSAYSVSIPITQSKTALLNGHETLLGYDQALDAWTLTIYW